MEDFDPNKEAVEGNIFGLPFTVQNAEVVILPVPWEATVSYGKGTSNAPEAILQASRQVDLVDPTVQDAWKTGIAMADIPSQWKNKSDALRAQPLPDEINVECSGLNEWTKKQCDNLISQDKLVGILGGEHSVALGLLQSLADQYAEFGILQIDAHADLRDGYQGYEFSHASIMHNALQLPCIQKLVQVGVRDYSPGEAERQASDARVVPFPYHLLAGQKFCGNTWKQISNDIISQLPEHIYISFDIDGLDPRLCPNTGAPVPGGLEFEEAVYLINLAVRKGRKIIGFDLCEVAPGADEWDANVGARVLYRLCNLMAESQGRTPE